MTHALEDGVGSEARGELEHALDGRLSALADDVGGAEIPRQRDAVGVTAEQDDPFRAQSTGGDDPAEADRAVADHGRDLARADLRGARGVVPCAHHVRKREKRGHERVVAADGKPDERAVRQRDADGLALAAVELAAPEPAVEARGLESLSAELACAIRPGERGDDEVALLNPADEPDRRLLRPQRSMNLCALSE